MRSSPCSSRSRRSSAPARCPVIPFREAEEALHRSVAASRIVATIPSVRGPVATSVDGRIAAQAVDGAGLVMILDASGALVRSMTADYGAVTDMAFTPDGANLISAGADGWLRSWDTERGSLVWERHDLGAAKGITLDASGSLVAARWPKAGLDPVADVDTGHVVRTFGGLHDLASAALGPDGAWLAMSTTGSSGVEAGPGPFLLIRRRCRCHVRGTAVERDQWGCVVEPRRPLPFG